MRGAFHSPLCRARRCPDAVRRERCGLRGLAGDTGSADGMLHERHALSDAHAGVARLRFEARHQPGAGGYLLRSHLESHSIVRRELDVRPVARNATPGRRRPGRSRGGAGAPGMARPRPAAGLACSKASPPFRPAGVANTVVVSLPGRVIRAAAHSPFVCSRRRVMRRERLSAIVGLTSAATTLVC